MNVDFPCAVLEMPVRDLGEAVAYYEHSLGFTVDWRNEDLGLAGISRGQCRLFLANAAYRAVRGTAGPVLIWLNLKSKGEVDELYRLWGGSHAKVIAEPESKPWGLHEFTAQDLDGNLLRVFHDFGTPRSRNEG